MTNTLYKIDTWQWLANQPDKSIDHVIADHNYGDDFDLSAVLRVCRGNLIIFDYPNWFGWKNGPHPTQQYFWLMPDGAKVTSRKLASKSIQVMYIWQYGVYNDPQKMHCGNRTIRRYDVVEGELLSDMQKPLSLYRWMLELHTEPGSKVLDLFAGTGTGFEAGTITGRTVIGCETDNKMYEIAETRMKLWQNT